ncbi:AAA-ATPase ASD, mitochondrial-like [Impatiens glandulifera]|uniref:AAA-ATPase ASD, mitochondrial-like n=1 Tax=Impatiens glandulifera TaxID=253017 RepID=UPI001FB12EE7|nr:AAA-ATPase ASD, mitochondrial-like [Impatiens glandulifera]
MLNFLPFMSPHSQWTQPGGGINLGLPMAIAASMVVFTMFQQFIYSHFQPYAERFIRKFISSMDPYVQIKFHEDRNEGSPKNYEAYKVIETYLSSKCSSLAPRLRANAVKDISEPAFCIDDGESVSDQFNGITFWWQSHQETSAPNLYRMSGTKTRYYTLTFRRIWRDMVEKEYIKHVMKEGKAATAKNRQLKLYSNSSAENGAHWNYIMDCEYAATFDTLAMEKLKKKDIVEDLMAFTNAKEYYRKIGKPWKRGYLLHGPPGTGKSTMIAAMANLLKYDVYDLELSAVSSNASLKRLLNRIPCNSILVVEDIDCSSTNVISRPVKGELMPGDDETMKMEKVTLSGILNCLDGLFSASEGGRLTVFTTNHVDQLDSALIRRGRMDKHILMSYCGFEAFKVLAWNYLGIMEDTEEEHELFPRIRELLKEGNMTPADVAENLMIKNTAGAGEEAVYERLQNLIGALEEKINEAKERKDPQKKTCSLD